VHLNNVLTNVQKLNYLRAHLEGEAARAVAGFPLISVNYQESLDVLRCHRKSCAGSSSFGAINRVLWGSPSSHDTGKTSN